MHCIVPTLTGISYFLKPATKINTELGVYLNVKTGGLTFHIFLKGRWGSDGFGVQRVNRD